MLGIRYGDACLEQFELSIRTAVAATKEPQEAVDVLGFFGPHPPVHGDQTSATRGELCEGLQPPRIFMDPLGTLREE